MTARRWLPPTLWAAFTLVLTSIPGADIPVVPLHDVDKVVHLVLYGTLGFLAVRAVTPPRRPTRAAILVLVAIACFAALDEIHQRFIPGRSMELFDWVADTLGAAAGGGLALATARRGERA